MMYVATIAFTFFHCREEAALNAVDLLLGTWRMNGQVLGREFPMARTEDGVTCTLLLPDSNALEARYDSVYMSPRSAALAQAEVTGPTIVSRTPEPNSAEPCRCKPHTGLILYTDYLSLESPLRCADCFGPIPLYQMPPPHGDDYYDAICWQSDYQAFDHLQMSAVAGERLALHQMGKHDSALSRQGRAICEAWEAKTGLTVFYYLYRHYGKSLVRETARRCPSCDSEWRLPRRLHGRFDFRCDKCRLLSNVAHSLSHLVERRPRSVRNV